eukprot:2707074-Pyramimonas_sp.AAC.1
MVVHLVAVGSGATLARAAARLQSDGFSETHVQRVNCGRDAARAIVPRQQIALRCATIVPYIAK